MASDIARIRRDYPLSDVAGSFGVRLQKNGDEFEACCPFHAEKSPSFTIYPGRDGVQRFFCFGCGEKGDVLDFVQGIKGVDLKDAISILGGKSAPNVAPRKIEVRDPYADIQPIPLRSPIAAGSRVRLYNPKRAGTDREWGSFVPSLIHLYRTADGRPFGYVLRHDLPGGDKETPMVMLVRLPGGKECWSRFPFPKPRPLYGVETIGDTRQVIVVEGEKCADALRKAMGRVVVSWAGGTQGVKHADWSPLAGRDVIMWPDADKPGFATADEIGALLHGKAERYRVLDLMGHAA